MSIANLDPAISTLLATQQNAVQSQIQFALADKQQTATQQQGEALVALIETAANLSKSVNTGRAFDAVG